MRRTRKTSAFYLKLMIVCFGFALIAGPGLAQTGTAASKAGAARLPRSERFSTTAAALQHCPGDTVVWSSFSKSKVFHLSSSKYFGKTKHGAYACEKDAVATGYHASKR